MKSVEVINTCFCYFYVLVRSRHS